MSSSGKQGKDFASPAAAPSRPELQIILLSASLRQGRSENARRGSEGSLGRAGLAQQGTGTQCQPACRVVSSLKVYFFYINFWFKCGFPAVCSINRYQASPRMFPWMPRGHRKSPFGDKTQKFPFHPPIPPHRGGYPAPNLPESFQPPKIRCHQWGLSPPNPFPIPNLPFRAQDPHSQTLSVPRDGCQALGGFVPHPSPRQGLQIKLGFVGFN